MANLAQLMTAEDAGTPARPMQNPELSRDAIAALGEPDPDSDTTLARYIEHYVELHPGKALKDWKSAARNHVVPKLGDREIASLQPRDVAELINYRIDAKTMRRPARRVVRDACGIALAEGLLTQNPAGEALDVLLCDVDHVTKHHDAVDWREAPALYAALRDDDSTGSRVLRLQMLSAVRPGEAQGARWSEIDLDAKTWAIPAERMKARKTHVVPLSDEAQALLSSIDRDGDLVFSGISVGVVRRTWKRHADAKMHGLRSTFRDWVQDTREDEYGKAAEYAIAHMNGTQVERSYARSTMLDKRRALMSEWADYLRQRSLRSAHDDAQSRIPATRAASAAESP